MLNLRNIAPERAGRDWDNTTSNTFHKGLLHLAHTSCCKVMGVGLLTSFALALSGCYDEVERYTEMVAYHEESTRLPQVSVDSVGRFAQKVDDFVTIHPSAKSDPLYPEIQQNIQSASCRITFTLQEEWDGGTVIEF